MTPTQNRCKAHGATIPKSRGKRKPKRNTENVLSTESTGRPRRSPVWESQFGPHIYRGPGK